MILVGDFIPKTLGVKMPDEFRGQLVLANLEGPICDDGLPTSNKVGVCLHTSKKMFECSECSNVRIDESVRLAFSLANNHTMDFCEEGLRQTKEVLDAHGIPYAGAGANEEEARRPMILEEDGHRIAVFSCCERQFGMAIEDTTGCAAKGPWLYSAIHEVKASGQADFVIVSCHAASEFSPWPCPVLRDFYHSLIDAGADCIHGHHSHVPQGFEEYHGKPIFYGLGNFVVRTPDWGTFRHYLWSVVAMVHFADLRVTWQAIPYDVAVSLGMISVSESNDVSVLEYMNVVNRPLSGMLNLEGCWQDASCRLYPRLYAQGLRMPSVVATPLSFRDRIRKLYFAVGDVMRAILGHEMVSAKSVHYGKVSFNIFNCESHVEMIRTALGVAAGIIPDCRTEGTTSATACLMKEAFL